MTYPFTIFVLATTPEGTRAALRAANRRAQGRCNILLLVPCLTARPDPSGAADNPAALIDQYHRLAREVCPAAVVYVIVCAQPEDAFRQFLTGPATVLIGGHRGVWWRPTVERRLARRLSRQGHLVVFEDLGRLNERVPSAGASVRV